MVWRIIPIVVAIPIIVTLVYYENKINKFMNFDKVVFDNFPGKCKIVKGIEKGCEDVQTLRNGQVLITHAIKYGVTLHDPVFSKLPGAIYLFDFNHPDRGAEELRITGKDMGGPNFSPVGLATWQETPTAPVYVYVINHPVDKKYCILEKFQFFPGNKTLHHLREITDDSFELINDIFMLGEDQFYISNMADMNRSSVDVYFDNKYLRATGELVYYSGGQGKTVATGVSLANGVAVSPDGKYVYLSACFGGSLNIYERHPDNSTTLIKEVWLGTLLDNIQLDVSSGSTDLWIGCHPVPWKVMKLMADPTYKAPSQVLRLTVDGPNVTAMEEVFSDAEGDLISGSTSVTYYKKAMLVGSLYDHLVYCDVPHTEKR